MLANTKSMENHQLITTPRATQLREQKELLFAKKGLLLGIVSGLTWAIASVLLLGEGFRAEAFKNPELWVLTPILAAGMHDFSAAITGFILNCFRGQAKELWRTLVSAPGRYCILGGVFGAPLGMGGYLLAISMAGPAYVLPITSLFPAIAAVLAMFFLKENISKRAWAGLFSCIIGAFVISYTPPSSGPSEFFYLGLFFAVVAAIGWAGEGVLVTSAMDFVEPGVALNIYQITSSFLFFCFIIPFVCFVALPESTSSIDALSSLLVSPGMLFVVFAGIVGSLSYNCWYKAMNTTGISRAMALNITYALWGVLLSAIIMDTEITTNLIIGSLVIFAGMVLVIGNPKDIVNLRNTN